MNAEALRLPVLRRVRLVRPVGVGCLLLAAAACSQPNPSSLLPNGSFEQADPADPTRPASWGKPDGLGVQWADSNDAAHGKAIRMDTRVTERAMMDQWRKTGLTNEWNIPKPSNGAVAETYGLSLYSEPIPVKPGQPYRITFDFRGHTGGAKVWVRCYGQLGGQKRQLYNTTVECRAPASAQWSTISQGFFPTRARPGMKNLQNITEMRVMLFAFYPAGIYWFDNVRIEPISVAEYEAAKR
jgi:hypothetical protein